MSGPFRFHHVTMLFLSSGKSDPSWLWLCVLPGKSAWAPCRGWLMSRLVNMPTRVIHSSPSEGVQPLPLEAIDDFPPSPIFFSATAPAAFPRRALIYRGSYMQFIMSPHSCSTSTPLERTIGAVSKVLYPFATLGRILPQVDETCAITRDPATRYHDKLFSLPETKPF